MKNIFISATMASAALLSVSAFAQSSPEQRYIETAFQKLDLDGDRQISRQEFDTFMLSRISKQKAEFERGFMAADVNGDGKISKKEAKVNPLLEENFVRIDANGDGLVTREELITALMVAQADMLPSN